VAELRSMPKFRKRVRFPLPARFRQPPFCSCEAACLRLRSHATFLRTTWPPFTSVRVFPSFGSNTLTSAGSAARNPQKFATPLYLNAASRTAFAVSGRRAFAVRESRSWVAGSEGEIRDTEKEQATAGAMSPKPAAVPGLAQVFRTDRDRGL
jgi:hypothetical protein